MKRTVKSNEQKSPKPIGYAILTVLLIAGGIMPSLSVIKPDKFVGLANSAIPEGIPRDHFGSLSEEPVFKAVIENGGQILLVTELEDTNVKDTIGLWDPNEGAIKLLIGSFTYKNYTEVLKHEAIHMAQSCFNSGIKEQAIPIGLKVTETGMRSLEPYRLTNPTYYYDQAEREAHSHDTSSDSFVISLLDRHCGTKPWIKTGAHLKNMIQMSFLPRSIHVETYRKAQEKSYWLKATGCLKGIISKWL